MAAGNFLSDVASLLTPALARAIGVFLLQTFGAWGLGDWIVSRFRLDFARESRLAAPLLAVAVGFGATGQALFIAGALANAYQKPVVLTAMAALALFGASRLRNRAPSSRTTDASRAGVVEWAVMLLAAAYTLQSLWILIGFGIGSDVFSHHYPFVKFSIRAEHFAHPAYLPFGVDHVSSYNPALARMLWLPGHLLSDERAANLFHWLTNVMMMAALYISGRGLQSRRAGLISVGAYLSIGLMAYNPFEAQDYTLTALLLTLSAYFVVTALRDDSRPRLVLAGVLAGLMLSSKYYAVPLAGLLAGAIVLWQPAEWRSRIKSALLFGVTALIVFAPWVIYNLIVFHDPLFPFLRTDDELIYYRATEWVAVLAPFVQPADRSFFVPTVFYYLSLFVPFSAPYRTQGLSVLFLIGLPASAYYVWRVRSMPWRAMHVLFVLGVVSFVVLHVLVGKDAHYKWAQFPAAFYAVSFGLLVDRLPRRGSHALALMTLAAAGLTYWYTAHPFMGTYLPGLPATRQEVRWSEVDQYLNANAEPDAVVTGTDYGYYLRPDLTGIMESSRVSFDWPTEEQLIRRAHVNYMIVDPNELARDARLNAGWAATWRQLSPGNAPVADYLDQSQRRHEERNRRRAAFIAQFGTLEHEFSNGSQLFRLRLNLNGVPAR